MKLTAAIKKWLVDAGLAAANASDDEFKSAAADALMKGTLTAAKLEELTADPQAKEADQFTSKLDLILENQTKQGERLNALEQRGPETPKNDPAPNGGKAATGATGGNTPPTERKASRFELEFAGSPGSEAGIDTPAVRLVGADDRYDKSKTSQRFPAVTSKGAPHPFAGQPVTEGAQAGGRIIDAASDCERAVCGAYLKWAIRSEKGGDAGIPPAMRMTEHDRDLVQYALHEMKWGGAIHGTGIDTPGAIGVNSRKLTPSEIKAVIDDGTSGGLEIAPIAFDDMVITIPILNGEIYPRVNVVNITRGRRIEGGSIGNVVFNSGGADDSAIPLFNTASFISAFDTTIFVVDGSIEIGLDFLSDSPIDVSGIIAAQYGQQLLAWLDEQCAVGDGTTEPEGVMNASGTTSVSSANGAGGPPEVGDYEGLLFGVPKNYKANTPTNRITYAANETTYQRARSIPVGTSDERRVFGMTHEDYMLLGHPFAINEQFTNAQVAFTNWARYRMYRRLGLTIKVTTEGKELTRNNLMLMTARARYGGQLEDGSAAAVITDAQA